MDAGGAEVAVDVEENPELAPIYTALTERGAPRRRGNIGCSGSKKHEFCYLCNCMAVGLAGFPFPGRHLTLSPQMSTPQMPMGLF